jgi:hypothetical protein
MSVVPLIHALRGEVLWRVSFAAETISLQFGNRRPLPTKRDPLREVGEFALHVQCQSVVRLADGTLIEPREILADHGSLKVTGVVQHQDGKLVLELDGITFTITPDRSDPREQWRLFKPGQPTPHVVFENGRLSIE